MDAVRVIAVLVYTLGAFAFGAMLAVSWRERGRTGWTGRTSQRAQRGESELVGGVLGIISLAWFLVNLLLVILQFGPPVRPEALHLATIWLTLTFPPLIMHITLAEVAERHDRSGTPGLHAGWRASLWVVYAAAQATALLALLGLTSALAVPARLLDSVLNYGIGAAFVTAAVYSIALMTRHRPTESSARARKSHGSTIALFVLMVPLFAATLLLISLDGWARMPDVVAPLVDVVVRSLPLMFIFVGTYHENRYEFFEIFVKRGLWLLVTMSLLTASFIVALPVLQPFHGGWAAPGIYALFLLPIVLLMPWLRDTIARAIDRRWLGRRFGTIDALKRFITGLQSATTEAETIEQAEKGFGDIFGAPARVQLGRSKAAPGFDVVQEIPIATGGGSTGRILLGARASEAPYFGQDLVLAASLAGVFSSVLDNRRLQERRREQEQLAREMALQASRSELKALRAQINPHFFFNALNAIAGLVHRDPAGADRIVEQLAEVFRYALRGSLDEWARVEDELDVVRSYLAIEEARFGPRLQVDVRCSPDAAGARIPTLAIQTLVENALKHGIADVPGTALVHVDARVDADRLVVSVLDNGRGFDPGRTPGAGSGYGLGNVRRRLEGYFGSAAALEATRDERNGRTIVTITMPHCMAVPAQAGSLPPRSGVRS